MKSARRHTTTIFLAFWLVVLTTCSSSDDLASRQAEVAEAGAEVMPFDLDATTHIFTATDSGGTQEVIADDASDADNREPSSH